MVRWQQTDFYKGINEQVKKTGVSYAEFNTYNNPNRNLSTGEIIATQLPSIFMTLATKLADGSWGGGSNTSASTANSEAVAQQIRADIDAILNHKTNFNGEEKSYKELGITSVDDLEAYLETKESDANNNVQTQEQNVQTNNTTVTDLTNRNQVITTELAEIDVLLGSGEGSIDAEISKLEEERENALHNGTSTSEIDSQIEELEKQKEELKTKKKTLEDEKTKNDSEITTAQSNIEQSNKVITDFNQIKKDIDDLKVLSKQLKKAEGKDAIESLTNEETADITDLIDKYQKADTEEKKKLEPKLTEALKEYVENKDNKNQTIIKYAEMKFNIK